MGARTFKLALSVAIAVAVGLVVFRAELVDLLRKAPAAVIGQTKYLSEAWKKASTGSISIENDSLLAKDGLKEQEQSLARAQDALRVQALTGEEMRSLNISAGKASLLAPTSGLSRTAAGFDEEDGRLWLRNGYLAISLGYGGARHGELSVLHLPSQNLIVYRSTPEVRIASGERLILANGTRPGQFRFASEWQPELGSGQSVEATYVVQGSSQEVTVRLTLYDGSPYYTYELRLEKASKDVLPVEFHLFSSEADAFNLGEDVEYVTDYSLPRRGMVRDDGVARKEAIGFGKPLLVWSSSRAETLLLAAIDETDRPSYLRMQVDPGRVTGKMGLVVGEARARGVADVISSPRLYVEVTGNSDARQAFDNFKRVMGTLYPPAPLPSWVKYQWLSWYVYFMDINEEVLTRQIDYIATNLADLGTWSILVDAGWYVSEGREGSDWRNVDIDKFPSGLRALVDYAHANGLKVVLYFSAPYLDSGQQPGDWLGLRDIIEKHPDWLILLGDDGTRQIYVYDFSNPDLRQYMSQVMEDFFVRYDVDGIKLDGLGNAGSGLLGEPTPDSFGPVDVVVKQTMDFYRLVYENASQLKPDVYVESGWLDPVFAHRYAHTFRFGDETNTFSNPYPTPGLVEHIDYAALQKMALGQRANMGALTGDPNLSVVNQWWLGAGLALGTQVVLSFYLPSMSGEALSEYRSLLMHYNAFAGETRFGGSLSPDSFATTVGETTYLGILNRGAEEKIVQLRLSDFGLDGDGRYAAYDVGQGSFALNRGEVTVQMPGESFRLQIMRSSPGVLWTNSSLQGFERTGSAMTLAVGGPRSIEGFLNLYSPEPSSVLIDGRQLQPSPFGDADENTFWYDPGTSILTLRYNHDGTREIVVNY